MRWGAPPPRGSGGGGGSYHVFGVFILRPIAWLIAAVIVMSAFGSLLGRMGIPLLRESLLYPERVWGGELWRLVTWAPIELSPLGLIFGCLLLYFIGPDLLRRWGTRRFFINFFAGAAVTGAIVCMGSWLLWASLGPIPYMGLWPMQEAMIIAWAALFPDRQILLFFALPTAGRNLIGMTIAITVVMAALGGFPYYVPHFVAEAVALLYMDVVPVRSWIARARLAWFQRGYKRRTAKFTRIDRDDDPPRWTH
jgi:membrane associated rhomboid family serine protease